MQVRGKALYFEYRSLNEIAQQLSVSTSQISRWRKEQGWLIEREHIERGLIEDGFSRRKLTIARIANATTDLIEKAIAHVTRRAEPPTIAETEKLSLILSNLDRIGRLDVGKATENIAVHAKLDMNADAIRRIILADPARAYEPPDGNDEADK